MQFPFAEIETKIGYVFRDKSLLQEAFTHSTYANAYGGKDNERMEYLGDAVLQLVVTDWQYRDDSRASEGELTRERQDFVCEDALDKAVRGLGIEKYLLVAGGSSNVGKKTVSSLFETVIAAIYLDGGYEPAKKFILNYAVFQKQCSANPKGELQEYLQAVGQPPPAYTVKKEGKDNAPTFYATVSAMGKTANGTGNSKKQAEAQAAAALLQTLKKHKR